MAQAKDGVNKMEAVRQVIAKYGKDVMPVEIVKYVKEEHGAEMNADVASNYKSSILRKMGLGGKRKRGRKAKAVHKQVGMAVNGIVMVSESSDDISLEDVQAVKQLVDRMGSEKVRQLARVLA